MGAWATMFTKVTVAQNHLNPGAWNGYQLFYIKNAQPVQAGGFKFKAYGTPFAFYFNVTDSGGYGVYINYPTADSFTFYRSNAAGQWVQRRFYPINNAIDTTEPDEWATFNFTRSGNNLSCTINGKPILQTQAVLPALLQPGFRGSNAQIEIDDVFFKNANDETVFEDDFGAGVKIHAVSVILILVLFIPLGIAIRFRKGLENVFLLNLVILIGWVIYANIFYYTFSTQYYQKEDDINYQGLSSEIEDSAQVCSRIAKEFPIRQREQLNPAVIIYGVFSNLGCWRIKCFSYDASRCSGGSERFFK
jgi:hypothetical protein